MLPFTILEEDGIVVVEPTDALSQDDFIRLTIAVDKFLESHESLAGLMIKTEHFPGWKDFQSMLSHLTFVREHHQQIKKIALVTDSSTLSIAEGLAKHFLSANLKKFEFKQEDEALQWMRS